MLNGRYQIRAKPPSQGAKQIDHRSSNRKPKLYHIQDRPVHVLGFFPTSEQFVSSYVNQRTSQGAISEDLVARTVKLDKTTIERLILLLSTGHNLTLDDLSHNPVTFFYDVLNTIKDDVTWSDWKEEYGVKVQV